MSTDPTTGWSNCQLEEISSIFCFEDRRGKKSTLDEPVQKHRATQVGNRPRLTAITPRYGNGKGAGNSHPQYLRLIVKVCNSPPVGVEFLDASQSDKAGINFFRLALHFPVDKVSKARTLSWTTMDGDAHLALGL
ncbi:hypothetical protein CVT26_009721 [Gymnopilus dilepis]|uniref:Uncharacterized protein n=1 Tax=Gymnopilus dilepis TaxID=231916 RepID=A0A409YBI0_9AGAR|nr:hypothetical protein CVT26_009721 [Gymnopilus dilepis]